MAPEFNPLPMSSMVPPHPDTIQARLFLNEHRLVAHRTIGRISAMIRSFIAGNVGGTEFVETVRRPSCLSST